MSESDNTVEMGSRDPILHSSLAYVPLEQFLYRIRVIQFRRASFFEFPDQQPDIPTEEHAGSFGMQ